MHKIGEVTSKSLVTYRYCDFKFWTKPFGKYVIFNIYEATVSIKSELERLFQGMEQNQWFEHKKINSIGNV